MGLYGELTWADVEKVEQPKWKPTCPRCGEKSLFLEGDDDERPAIDCDNCGIIPVFVDEGYDKHGRYWIEVRE